MSARAVVPVVLGLVASVALSSASQELTRAEAESMSRKLEAIVERGSAAPAPEPAPQPKPVTTSFTEREVNAYFKYLGPLFMPTGVTGTQLTIGGDGHVQSRAVVDLDAIRQAQPRGWLDPLAWLGGSMEVKASGRVRGVNGKGVFQFESAYIAGVPVSKALLQELVTFYTRSPELPKGFNLDEPFDLPSNIRSVETRVGAATVVQ
jgi:hypothetical protein